jgi:hypothetical protein
LGQRFLRLARAQDEGAGSVGFLANAPILQRFTRDLGNLPIAAEGKNEFVRLTLQDIDGGIDGVGDFSRSHGNHVRVSGGEKKGVLVAGEAGQLRLNDEAGLAILNAAIDRKVFEFGGGKREEREGENRKDRQPLNIDH